MSAFSGNESQTTPNAMQSDSGGCKDVNCKELLQLIVDGQASQSQETYFKEHICECMSCLESYNLDSAVKKALMDKCRDKKAPKDLIHSIREHHQNAQ